MIQSKYFWFFAADFSPLCDMESVAGGIRNVEATRREFKPHLDKYLREFRAGFFNRTGCEGLGIRALFSCLALRATNPATTFL